MVALAGGVGGAKLAHGFAQILPDDQLTVVVNVGDDFVHYGLHISPDVDTVMYTLAGLANPKTGWGIVDDTWGALEMLKRYGEHVWFGLGDHDLATHLLRTDALAKGERLTTITQRLASRLGIKHHILPMTDDRLATTVHTRDMGTLPFQRYFVEHRWQPVVSSLSYEGSESARMTDEVQQALDQADLIVICPSNPMLSIAPILALKDLRRILMQRQIPCVAVSPLISGKAVKGPTDKLMLELHMEPTTVGIAKFYDGLIDCLIIDDCDQADVAEVTTRYPSLSIYQTQTLMQNETDRQALARRILDHINEVDL